jgi:hypothetical protein
MSVVRRLVVEFECLSTVGSCLGIVRPVVLV